MSCVSQSRIIVRSTLRGGRNAILVIGDEARTWFMLTVVSLDTGILIGVTTIPSFSLQPSSLRAPSEFQNQKMRNISLCQLSRHGECEQGMRCGELASVNRVTSWVFIVLFGSLGPMTILCRNLEHK